MADPHVLSAPQDKVYELRQAIVAYEERLTTARKELAIVTATQTIGPFDCRTHRAPADN